MMQETLNLTLDCSITNFKKMLIEITEENQPNIVGSFFSKNKIFQGVIEEKKFKLSKKSDFLKTNNMSYVLIEGRIIEYEGKIKVEAVFKYSNLSTFVFFVFLIMFSYGAVVSYSKFELLGALVLIFSFFYAIKVYASKKLKSSVLEFKDDMLKMLSQ